MRKRLAVFGATGSIGCNTLELARRFTERFEVTALTAGHNIDLLRRQIEEYKPKVVVTREASDAVRLGHIYPGIEFLHGDSGLVQCATWDGFDIASQGIVGFAALAPTLELLKSGKLIALANKESLVVAGHLLREELERGARCIPVDSEHNAIYQLLLGKERSHVRSIVLTASGGPFWKHPDLDLSAVKPEVAIQHPNWKMGPKISVDSATLMNKGLEVVEAHVLFGFGLDQIEVVVHPQSIVHGALWLTDGTSQAQLSKPDMKASIAFAIGYPDRLLDAVETVPLSMASPLEFFPPDTARFPCLDLPRKALAAGQSHLIALNAGNEVAVKAYLEGRIRFTDIPNVLEELLEDHCSTDVRSLEAIFAVDLTCRENTHEIIEHLSI